jgi:hypothetical protein
MLPRNPRDRFPADRFPADDNARPPRPLERGSLDEDAPADQGLKPIARFVNAAEGGFFAHELSLKAQCPVELRSEEDYDALAGLWTTRFLLCVPARCAEEATVALAELVERSEHEDFLDTRPLPLRDVPELTGPIGRWDVDDFAADRFGAAAGGEGPVVHWVPIVLTLAAGSMMFWGFRKLNEAPPRPPLPAGHRTGLWESLSTSEGRVWVQLDRQGRAVRELEVDAEAGVAVIREDRDGDAAFDHTRRLHRDEL